MNKKHLIILLMAFCLSLGEISRQDVVIFTVTFNTNGKVIAYNSVKDYPYYRH